MAMTEEHTGAQSLVVRDDQPLIGVIVEEDGEEVTRYFTDEEAARAAQGDTGTRAALRVVGAWADLDWEETARELDRIRHESKPTPPIEDL